MRPGRLRRSDEFQRALRGAVVERSAHFAVHHAPASLEAASAGPASSPAPADLSTGPAISCTEPVDDFDPGCRIGCLVPKRHARRSVTRSLVKRQVRAAVERLEIPLAPGLWLVRLRSGFPVDRFPSAASPALRAALRAELDALLPRCGRGTRASAKSVRRPGSQRFGPESAVSPDAVDHRTAE